MLWPLGEFIMTYFLYFFFYTILLIAVTSKYELVFVIRLPSKFNQFKQFFLIHILLHNGFFSQGLNIFRTLVLLIL